MNFDEEFFAAVGLAGASQEEKLGLAAQLAETVQNRVAVRLSEVLTEAEMSQFADLIESGEEQHDTQGDKAFEYLASVYPDYELLIQDEVLAVKHELAHDVA